MDYITIPSLQNICYVISTEGDANYVTVVNALKTEEHRIVN